MLACREAPALAHDLSLSKIVIACDCKYVVDNIMSGSGGNYEAIVKEFKTKTNSFVSCLVTFEGRASNSEAHSVSASSATPSWFWSIDDKPS